MGSPELVIIACLAAVGGVITLSSALEVAKEGHHIGAGIAGLLGASSIVCAVITILYAIGGHA